MGHIRSSRIRIVRVLALILVIVIFTHLQWHRSRDRTATSRALPKVKRDGVKNHSSHIHDVYDYIVVGGGQSGLTVGNRLSESGRTSVLVVEYGHLYRDDPLIARPWQPFDASKGLFHDPKLMYNFSSTPQPGLNDRTSEISAAAAVGGGSTVNGMFLNRGSAEDYDAWEKLGNPGWGWQALLPYFKKSSTFTPPNLRLQEEFGATYDEAAYGKDGPIHLSNPEWAWPGQRLQMEGWKEMGIEQSKEGAGGDAVGMFWVPRAQRPIDQTRSYSVTGHLDPALERDHFDLLQGYRVNQIMLSKNKRAEGVVVQRRGGNTISIVHARKEVILAAGLHTPAIMQRSGIGPKHVLEEAGIDVQVELPGVGMNLQDHPAAGLAYSFTTDFPLNPSTLNFAQAEDEYRRTRSGPHSGGHNIALFLPADSFHPNTSALVSAIADSDPSQSLPPIYNADPTLLAGYSAQVVLLTEAYASNKSTLIGTPVAGDAYSLLILQKPFSRGTITIDPNDPLDGNPLVDYGTFTEPLDVDVMIAIMEFTRRWYKTDAMKKLGPVEQAPGESVTGASDLEAHVREHGESTIGHQSGTTAMMPLDLGGVVDPDLVVYGVKGLSVVDASIMPLIPSTNLCATVYAVAEKAADLIKKRNQR